jgi:hypothetical protein
MPSPALHPLHGADALKGQANRVESTRHHKAVQTMQTHDSRGSHGSYGRPVGPGGSFGGACAAGIKLADGPKIQDEKKPVGLRSVLDTWVVCTRKGVGE